ncbi:MAG: hypothetical protein ACYC25_03850 [Paludibacter sp.]
MKRIIEFILAILFISTSCTKNVDHSNKNNSDEIDTNNLDEQFSTWLNGNNLNKTDCISSKAYEAFELWSQSDSDLLTKDDSLLLWYPSKDSSYYLITNYNKNTNKLLSNSNNSIELKFLDTQNKKLYVGIMLLDSLKERRIDYYWYDPNTFYFLEKSNSTGKYILTKIKMGVDSIWTYNY